MPRVTGSDDDADATLAAVAAILRDAGSVLFVTGAGVSADSGLPTYRGVGGLYDDRHTEDEVPIEEALSGPMFARRPDITWKYLWQIGAACHGARPNAAHEIMAALEADRPDVWVITQNVDGLHRAAGSRNLVEVHGDVDDLLCTRCGRGYTAAEIVGDYRTPPELPPRCIGCDGVVRPRVVLFEELLPDAVVRALHVLAERDFDVVLAVGTSAVFPYIQAPVARARWRGRPAVEINPADTVLTPHCTHRLRLGAAEAMERLRAAGA